MSTLRQSLKDAVARSLSRDFIGWEEEGGTERMVFDLSQGAGRIAAGANPRDLAIEEGRRDTSGMAKQGDFEIEFQLPPMELVNGVDLGEVARDEGYNDVADEMVKFKKLGQRDRLREMLEKGVIDSDTDQALDAAVTAEAFKAWAEDPDIIKDLTDQAEAAMMDELTAASGGDRAKEAMVVPVSDDLATVFRKDLSQAWDNPHIEKGFWETDNGFGSLKDKALEVAEQGVASVATTANMEGENLESMVGLLPEDLQVARGARLAYEMANSDWCVAAESLP